MSSPSSSSKRYDVIVIGGGHAGCEAALAASRMGRRVLMLNLSIDNTALMPCNPSIGGPAKGHLVREISALGGEQARAADASMLSVRWLNTSKGPAVRALRAQCDPVVYGLYYRRCLLGEKNLDVSQDLAVEFLVEHGDDKITGVRTRTGAVYEANAIVLCTGVYLGGRAFMGDVRFPSGPMGQPPSEELAASLKSLGINTCRMRTDTTPRLNLDTIDLSTATPQYTDPTHPYFDLWATEISQGVPNREGYACWFSRTTEATHEILAKNIHRSPLVSGALQSRERGPRYCPSIEDKFLKFPDRTSHPIVFEPISLASREVYVQNFSTSMPCDVQEAMVRSLPGCEHAKIVRYGYGIEYDAITPEQLTPTLELRGTSGLFTAGQINGTSGYEEAAAQGLLAGINAALYATGQEPIILGRADAYLGVLVDDLSTRGTDEPYRMLTSRCEHRLLLRWDNADRRLSHIGHRVGLINEKQWAALEHRWELQDREITRLRETKIIPSPELDAFCESRDAEIPHEAITAADFLRHRGVNYDLVTEIIGNSPDMGEANEDSDTPEWTVWVESELRYSGYLERETRMAGRLRSMDEIKIPPDFDFSPESLPSLSSESRQKLERVRPVSLGQALRIPGVTPADVQLLSVVITRHQRRARENDK